MYWKPSLAISVHDNTISQTRLGKGALMLHFPYLGLVLWQAFSQVHVLEPYTIAPETIYPTSQTHNLSASSSICLHLLLGNPTWSQTAQFASQAPCSPKPWLLRTFKRCQLAKIASQALGYHIPSALCHEIPCSPTNSIKLWVQVWHLRPRVLAQHMPG